MNELKKLQHQHDLLFKHCEGYAEDIVTLTKDKDYFRDMKDKYLAQLTTEKARAEKYRKLLVELLDTSDNISDDEYFKIKETLYGKDVEQAAKHTAHEGEK